MKRHANIPIFVPHIGCPNDCVFCNQRTISGRTSFDVDGVEEEIEKALGTISSFVPQVAFFGGSFTGIERSLMIKLLETANKFIKEGRVSSIRLSTRPDYIDEEILSILKFYKVANIELGIQSTNDEVLTLNKRGHDAKTSLYAMDLIVKEGFELTGQMMTGMFGGNEENERQTALDIISHGATSARVYPTVVFSSTALGDLYLSGKYQPPTLDETVERGAKVVGLFLKNNVDVIRIGLQSGEGLHSDDVIAGDYHDAIGELILSRLRLDEMREKLRKMDLKKGEKVFLEVPEKLLSQYLGQKKVNLKKLSDEFSVDVFLVKT